MRLRRKFTGPAAPRVRLKVKVWTTDATQFTPAERMASAVLSRDGRNVLTVVAQPDRVGDRVTAWTDGTSYGLPHVRGACNLFLTDSSAHDALQALLGPLDFAQPKPNAALESAA